MTLINTRRRERKPECVLITNIYLPTTARRPFLQPYPSVVGLPPNRGRTPSYRKIPPDLESRRRAGGHPRTGGWAGCPAWYVFVISIRHTVRMTCCCRRHRKPDENRTKTGHYKFGKGLSSQRHVISRHLVQLRYDVQTAQSEYRVARSYIWVDHPRLEMGVANAYWDDIYAC